MHIELGGKSVHFLRTKTQVLERLHCVSVVDIATHSKQDGVEVLEAP